LAAKPSMRWKGSKRPSTSSKIVDGTASV